ncbi:VOC family protein [Ruegeria marina]|uniref:Glyoxalase-like domain-containing protein n=1 Tax=Ruegeria marina TaxID=639004 RepID=A0A1G6UZP6_9RHOB|nr:VOC family protein [Ruegeria marina]SDD46116.1 Glyoxalase-like domain-containing protein [Ruegeria marina]
MSSKGTSGEELADKKSIRPRAVLETVLYVDDLDAASEFYALVMNLPLAHEDRRMKVFRLTDQNFLLLFKTGDTRQPINVPGGTIPAHDGRHGMHVALSIDHDEVEAWAQRLQDNNIPIESTVRWPSGDTSLYFRDPAGNLVELATPDLWKDR